MRLYTVRQIAKARGITVKSVRSRLENIVPAETRPHAGQPVRLYRPGSLPLDLRIPLIKKDRAEIMISARTALSVAIAELEAVELAVHAELKDLRQALRRLGS